MDLDIMKNADDLVSMMNFFKENPRPEDKPKALGNGVTDADDWYWTIVDKLDYPSDNNHRRISKLFKRMVDFQAIDSRYINMIESITKYKQNQLYNSLEGKITEYCSSDTWSDSSSYVVSKGKEFYESVQNDPSIFNQMLKNFEYSESFKYCFLWE